MTQVRRLTISLFYKFIDIKGEKLYTTSSTVVRLSEPYKVELNVIDVNGFSILVTRDLKGVFVTSGVSQ